MADTLTRTCTKCGKTKPATTSYFGPVGRGRSSPDGLQARCRECAREYLRRLRLRDPEMDHRYYSRTKHRHNAATKAYYLANKEALLEKQRVYNERYRREKRDHVIAVESARRERNRESIRASQRRYYERNARACNDRVLAWAKENPDKRRSILRNRRARMAKVGGTHTADDVKRQFEGQKGRCWWCNKKLKSFHVDHRIPIARGGSNGPENLVISCPRCNTSRGAKLPSEMPEPRLF